MESDLATTMQTQEDKVGFTTLPLEVRDMIWDEIMPDGRVFDMKMRQDAWGLSSRINNPYEVHPMDQLCHSSHHWALQQSDFFKVPADQTTTAGFVWFRPRKDTIYLDHSALSHIAAGTFDPDFIQGFDMVQRVAVEWLDVHQGNIAFIVDLLRLIPRMKHLTIYILETNFCRIRKDRLDYKPWPIILLPVYEEDVPVFQQLLGGRSLELHAMMLRRRVLRSKGCHY
ncbi:hypothetical protein F5B20DRAFT_529658 [Whalleya microplaca]|nr:hypothetical protein F5B20DRAFT_529658 [Whalleya microplaca]